MTSNDPNKSLYDKSQKDIAQQTEAQRQSVGNVAQKKASDQKVVSQQKLKSSKQPESNEVQGSTEQREVTCPTCGEQAKIKDRVAGKRYLKIPFLSWKVPRIWEIVVPAKSFDENTEVCGACKGKKKIKDVTDDSAKYKQVQQKLEQNSEKLLEAESKLGLGGSRTTFIAGSELLNVGLGFNRNKTYEQVKDGGIAPSVGGGEGKQKIPQANSKTATATVGKQGQIAWPQHVGNYTIKCANSFKLLAGAGGITLATNGPLTISAGIMRFSGPQLSIGSSTGPLTLEGESVIMTGKHVAIAPTGGQAVVRGSIAHTGNCVTIGHTHSEGMSFIKATTVGTNKQSSTDKANMDVSQTQPAIWGGLGIKGITNSILDLKLFYDAVPANHETAAQRLVSPAEMVNTSDRMTTLSKMMMLLELQPTGYILPGQCVVVGPGGTSTNPLPIPVYNMPHTHGIPAMQHQHDTKVPDMQLVDTPEQLRAQINNSSLATGAPADLQKDSASRLKEQAMMIPALAANIQKDLIESTSRSIKLA